MTTLYLPVRASAAHNLEEFFASNPTYKTTFDLLQFSKFEPPTPGYDYVRNEVSTALAAIVNGADVTETLNALNETANQILADQLEQVK